MRARLFVIVSTYRPPLEVCRFTHEYVCIHSLHLVEVVCLTASLHASEPHFASPHTSPHTSKRNFFRSGHHDATASARSTPLSATRLGELVTDSNVLFHLTRSHRWLAGSPWERDNFAYTQEAPQALSRSNQPRDRPARRSPCRRCDRDVVKRVQPLLQGQAQRRGAVE